jgi:hypothetical protein
VQLYVDAYNRKKAGAEAIAMLVEGQKRNARLSNAQGQLAKTAKNRRKNNA